MYQYKFVHQLSTEFKKVYVFRREVLCNILNNYGILTELVMLIKIFKTKPTVKSVKVNIQCISYSEWSKTGIYFSATAF